MNSSRPVDFLAAQGVLRTGGPVENAQPPAVLGWFWEVSCRKTRSGGTIYTERFTRLLEKRGIPMWQSDEQWVRRCRDEQPDAFRHLVERHQRALLGYLAGRLGSRDDAAEAAQETLVRAFFALGKLQKPESFFSWVMGIADRVVKETWRRRQRQPASLTREQEPPATESVEAPGPEVARAVAALPDMYREVILLRFYRERSCAEISRELDVPLGTVTKRLSRAYALLREALAEQSRSPVNEVRR